MGMWGAIFGRRPTSVGVATMAQPVSQGRLAAPSTLAHGGSPYSGGAPQRERNPGLRELRERQATYQEMERTDPVIKALVAKLVDTACEARIVVKLREVSPCDAALHERVTEDVREMWGWQGRASRLRGQVWADVLRGLVLAGPRGFALGVWGMYPGDGGLPWVERMLLPDLASVYRWTRDDAGRITGWEQYHEQGQPGRRTVPIDQTVIVTHSGDGDDPEGKAMLRACYAHWSLKRHAIESTGQTTDKAGVPPVVVDFDPVAMVSAGYSDAEAQAAREAAEEQAARFNRRQGGRLTNLPGITFRFLDTMFDPAALLSVEQRCDEAMAMAFGTPLDLVGRPASGGADKVGESQRDAFLRGVAARVDEVLDALTEQVVRPVIRLRHGERAAVELLPEVTHYGLRPTRVEQSLPYLTGLTAAGLLDVGPSVKARVKEALGLGTDGDVEDPVQAEWARAQANSAAHVTPGPGRGHVGEGAAVDALVGEDDVSAMAESGDGSELEDWMPAKDAASRFGCSPASLATMWGRGDLKRITINGRHKYLISDIERALGLRAVSDA